MRTEKYPHEGTRRNEKGPELTSGPSFVPLHSLASCPFVGLVFFMDGGR